MEFQDRILECTEPMHDENTRDADGNPAPTQFTFTAKEQAFYQERGFGDPRRCPACRQAKKDRHNNRQMHTATCDNCGQQAEVPFEPTAGRPVYCESCFNEKKQQRVAA